MNRSPETRAGSRPISLSTAENIRFASPVKKNISPISRNIGTGIRLKLATVGMALFASCPMPRLIWIDNGPLPPMK